MSLPKKARKTMTKDKQIDEMVMVLTESQHAFDRVWKECLHNNAPMPDRENVFYAKYLVEKEGYRKAEDVAREIEATIEATLNKMFEEYATLGQADCAVIVKIIWRKLSAELKKKYTEREKEK